MPRKKKYENAEIVKGILAREYHHIGDMKMCMFYKFLDFKDEENREFLKSNINEMIGIFKNALKELED